MEGKQTGHFENLDRPLDVINPIKSIGVIATNEHCPNATSAITKYSQPAGPLNDDNIDILSWNSFPTKNQDLPSKIPYAVDIAFDKGPNDVASVFHQPTYRVRI